MGHSGVETVEGVLSVYIYITVNECIGVLSSHQLRVCVCVHVRTENGTFNGSSEAERKTQSYYLSCLNTQRIEELGAQPLIDLINKVHTHTHTLVLSLSCLPASNVDLKEYSTSRKWDWVTNDGSFWQEKKAKTVVYPQNSLCFLPSKATPTAFEPPLEHHLRIPLGQWSTTTGPRTSSGPLVIRFWAVQIFISVSLTITL